MTDDKSLLFKSKCEGLRIFCHVTDAACYKSGLRIILDIQSAEENKKAIIFLDSVEEDPMLLQGMRQTMLGHDNERTGAKPNYFIFTIILLYIFYITEFTYISCTLPTLLGKLIFYEKFAIKIKKLAVIK